MARVDSHAVKEILEVEGRHYILVGSALVEERPRVLKHGDTFAVFDEHGDVRRLGTGSQGLYFEDTRFLSRLVFKLEGERPLLLNSTVTEDNEILAVDFTNPAMRTRAGVTVGHGTLHVLRSKRLADARCEEQLVIASHGTVPLVLYLSFELSADFADIFEVRGETRARRGEADPPQAAERTIAFSYTGLDRVTRRTLVRFSEAPTVLQPNHMELELALDPGARFALGIETVCEISGARAHTTRPSGSGRPLVPEPRHGNGEERRSTVPLSEECRIHSGNPRFNEWLRRSRADIDMLLTYTEHGPYPYAGVPWFSTMFGRDGIITALQTLWADPSIAHGVLANLAALQATEVDVTRDAEPGKILHERRGGEMAALGEVPFGRYYGSVDSTPLFVMLAGAYLERTADRAFIERLWPAVDRAVAWITRFGDGDGDGFVEYSRRANHGLVQQGWKDSMDSVFHADGMPAEGPTALCEVQGYTYGALKAAATIAGYVASASRAAELTKLAEELRRKFEERYWCEQLSMYALALDGDKQRCDVVASNASHCLFAGIASPERARRVAAVLMDERSFSGWGIRTLATTEVRYNPMSYHNGSIWPHDNSLAAAGMARYGLTPHALRVFSAFYDASLFLDLHRMPELYCGFDRRAGQGPILYPVACAPQAWAAGSVFLFLQASLGMEIDAFARRVVFRNPALPRWLERVSVSGLEIGEASLDLILERRERDVGVEVRRSEGEVEVIIVKHA